MCPWQAELSQGGEGLFAPPSVEHATGDFIASKTLNIAWGMLHFYPAMLTDIFLFHVAKALNPSQNNQLVWIRIPLHQKSPLAIASSILPKKNGIWGNTSHLVSFCIILPDIPRSGHGCPFVDRREAQVTCNLKGPHDLPGSALECSIK